MPPGSAGNRAGETRHWQDGCGKSCLKTRKPLSAANAANGLPSKMTAFEMRSSLSGKLPGYWTNWSGAIFRSGNIMEASNCLP